MWNWKHKTSKEPIQKPITIVSVAEYFLYLSKPTGINHTKLQKLVYYAQSLHLVVYQKPLFEEDFEAWVHGPISPELYYRYKTYGSQEIPFLQTPPEFDKPTTQIIEVIWKMYGRCSDRYLERKAFKEEPFQSTRKGISCYESCNEIISKERMKLFYAKKIRVAHKKMEEFS